MRMQVNGVSNDMNVRKEFPSDLRFSHVDIIVDDIQDFVSRWCPRLGFVASDIQTWGGPNEDTWSEFAFVTDQYQGGNLVFMIVQGHKGTHVDLLQKYGNGAIYRLCFKTDDLQSTYHYLRLQGTTITNLEGKRFETFQDVIDSPKRILWLEKYGELSIEILTAPIIDAAIQKFQKQAGIPSRRRSRPLSSSAILPVALVGGSFLLGYIFGRASATKR